MIQIIESGLQPLSFRFRWRRRRKAAGKKNERFEKITKKKVCFGGIVLDGKRKKVFLLPKEKSFHAESF